MSSSKRNNMGPAQLLRSAVLEVVPYDNPDALSASSSRLIEVRGNASASAWTRGPQTAGLFSILVVFFFPSQFSALDMMPLSIYWVRGCVHVSCPHSVMISLPSPAPSDKDVLCSFAYMMS